MTRRTVHGLENLVVIRMLKLHIHVATDARVRSVRGSRQFGFIDEKRDRLSRRIGFEKRVVRMTFETIAVF